jgi:hypothetical protein
MTGKPPPRVPLTPPFSGSSPRLNKPPPFGSANDVMAKAEEEGCCDYKIFHRILGVYILFNSYFRFFVGFQLSEISFQLGDTKADS